MTSNKTSNEWTRPAILDVVDFTPRRWAFVPGHPGYQASDDGEIRKSSSRKVLKQRGVSNDAMCVNIGSTSALVHTMILTAFTGSPLQPGYRVIHLDGDKSNNRLNNLAWTNAKPSHRCLCGHVGRSHKRGRCQACVVCDSTRPNCCTFRVLGCPCKKWHRHNTLKD